MFVIFELGLSVMGSKHTRCVCNLLKKKEKKMKGFMPDHYTSEFCLLKHMHEALLKFGEWGVDQSVSS